MSVSIDLNAQASDQPDWESVPDGKLVGMSIGSLPLDSGERIDNVTLAFQRWGGTLSPSRDNVILTLHALTGDSHVTGPADNEHEAPGWWDGLIGPGMAIDTDEWCVISANVLGGCKGSTGPGSLASDGRPWGGSRFPQITVLDQVRAEVALLDRLGIRSVGAVLGGSMGGARALEWAIEYPRARPQRTGAGRRARATADQIGIQTTQIAAIKSDPAWNGGNYHGTGQVPLTGMASPVRSRTCRTAVSPSSTSASPTNRRATSSRCSAAGTPCRATSSTRRRNSCSASTRAATSCSPRS